MAPDNQPLKDTRSPRVAIIAVHGVADQSPAETARTVATLIQKKGDVGCPVITENTVTINVEPAFTPDADAIDRFNERIRKYEPQERDAVFRTTVCSGTAQLHASHESGGEEEQTDSEPASYTIDIDVLEMFWADLSSIHNSIFHALVGLYRLFISMCDIAIHSLEPPNTETATSAIDPTNISAFVVGKALPILNLCLFSLFIYQVPFWIADSWAAESEDVMWLAQRLFASLAIAFVAGGTVAYGGSRSKMRGMNHASLGLLSLVSMTIVGSAVCWITESERLGFVIIVAATWLPSALAVIAICSWLDRDIPGIREWSVRVIALLLVVLVIRSALIVPIEPWSVLIMGMRAAEFLVLLTVILAGVFFVALAFMTIRHAVYFFKAKDRSAESIRLSWTAIIAVLVPGLALSVVNVGVWRALEFARPELPLAKRVAYESDFPKPYVWMNEEIPVKEGNVAVPLQLKPEFTLAEMPILLIRLVAVPLAVFVLLAIMWSATAIWLFFPCIHAETKTDDQLLGEGKGINADAQYCSLKLGNTLSDSFRFIRWATLCILVLSIPMYTAIYVCAVFSIQNSKHLSWLSIVCKVSTYSVSIVGLFFFVTITGLLQRSTTVLHAVIDIAVDVANWLRLNPRDNNPCSRISARYVSLLRYISNRKDVDGSDYYDGVVIVAHSLGSVISADVLRHLRNHEDESLEAFNRGDLPIYFFTFGSPLRQLLGLRLPNLYGWAFDEREVTNDDRLDDDRLPDPKQLLSVREWVNAYCSGDYVGRTLWFDDQRSSVWRTQLRESASRREFCVGAGAHTRYWSLKPFDNKQSRRVAREIVRLVVLAGRGRGVPVDRRR